MGSRRVPLADPPLVPTCPNAPDPTSSLRVQLTGHCSWGPDAAGDATAASACPSPLSAPPPPANADAEPDTADAVADVAGAASWGPAVGRAFGIWAGCESWPGSPAGGATCCRGCGG
eukprot:363200-Chlamydomonas_euryale.AAC.15